MTQEQAISIIEKATDPHKLLGKLPFAKSSYLKLAKLCHPDIVHGTLNGRAEAAFKKLQQFYDQLENPKKFVLKDWEITGPLAKGDLADVYRAVRGTDEAVMKVVRSPKDNDLMSAEAVAKRKIEENHSSLTHYSPKLLDTFKASGRSVNVMSVAEGIPLSELTGMYKELDFRHVVWMGNRLWAALGFFHRIGLIHGAITPSHLMYDMANHGLTIVDWCYSVLEGKPAYIKAIAREWKIIYPGEVLAKKTPSTATDIYMAARCLLTVPAIVPQRFKDIYQWCFAVSPTARPQDAWKLWDVWKEAAKELYGEPKFLELRLPTQ